MTTYTVKVGQNYRIVFTLKDGLCGTGTTYKQVNTVLIKDIFKVETLYYGDPLKMEYKEEPLNQVPQIILDVASYPYLTRLVKPVYLKETQCLFRIPGFTSNYGVVRTKKDKDVFDYTEVLIHMFKEVFINYDFEMTEHYLCGIFQKYDPSRYDGNSNDSFHDYYTNYLKDVKDVDDCLARLTQNISEELYNSQCLSLVD